MITRRTTIFRIGVGICSTAGCLGLNFGADDVDDRRNDPNEGNADDSDEYLQIINLNVVDLSTEETVANYHGHWHGEIPPIPLDEKISLGAELIDTDGNEISLGADETYQFDASLVDEADSSVVSITSHGDHIHLEGKEAGRTNVRFHVLQDSSVVWQTGEPVEVVIE